MRFGPFFVIHTNKIFMEGRICLRVAPRTFYTGKTRLDSPHQRSQRSRLLILRQTPSVHFARKSAPELFFAQPNRFVALLRQHGNVFLKKLGDAPDGDFARLGPDPEMRFSHRFQSEGDSLILVVSIQHGNRPWSSQGASAPVALAVALVRRSGQPDRCFSVESDPTTRQETIYESLPNGTAKSLWSGTISDEPSFLHRIGSLLQSPTPTGAPEREAPSRKNPATEPHETPPPRREMPTTPLRQVTPSGAFSPATVLPILAFGALATPLIAAAYRTAAFYMPIILVNVLFTVFAGIALAVVLFALYRRFRMQNEAVGMAIAFILGLVTVGASHYTSYHLYKDQIFEQAREVLSTAEFQQFVSEWSFVSFLEYFVEAGWEVGNVGSDPDSGIRGWLVYLVWLIEAGYLIGCAMFFVRVSLRAPFCDGCDRWLELRKRFTHKTPDELVTHELHVDAEVVDSVKAAANVRRLLSIAAGRSELKGEKFALLQFSMIRCSDHPKKAFIEVLATDCSSNKARKKTATPKSLVPWSYAEPEHFEVLAALASGRRAGSR